MIRALGLANAGRRERRTERTEEFVARRQAIEAAGQRLDQLIAERGLPRSIVAAIARTATGPHASAERRNDGDPRQKRLVELHEEIEFQLIAAERKQINDLYSLAS